MNSPKSESLRQASDLANVVHAFTSTHILEINGTSGGELTLLMPRKKAAELVQKIQTGRPRHEVTAGFEETVGQLRTAQVLGVLSEREADGFNKLTDNLWSAIKKEYA